MFKSVLISLSVVFADVDAVPPDNAVTISPWDYSVPIEEMSRRQLCEQGLQMTQMTEGVSDFDDMPLEASEIADINRSGEILVAKFCGPLA